MRTREILQEPVLEIGGLKIRPYLLGDAAYPSRPYLLKSFKPSVNDPRFQDKRRFDESLNSDRVVVRHIIIFYIKKMIVINIMKSAFSNFFPHSDDVIICSCLCFKIS